MAYNQTPPARENNNALYFIVGGLLVFALIAGAFVLNSNRAENAYEPAAGSETSAPAVTDTPADNTAAPAPAVPNTAPETTAPLAP